MTPGDTVRWRPDISKDRMPMTVFSVHGNAVKVDHAAGSIISADLLERDPRLAEGWTARKCPSCHGNGVDGSHQPCPDCGGTGEEYTSPAAAPPVGDDGGLLAVIEAQMEGINELQCRLGDLQEERVAADAATEAAERGLEYAEDEIKALKAAIAELEKEAEAQEAFQAGSDEGFREEVERMLGNVCMALGFPREPLVKTGIMELDALVRYVGNQ